MGGSNLVVAGGVGNNGPLFDIRAGALKLEVLADETDWGYLL